MRIGMDARMIDWGGVGRYTANLLRSLAEVGEGHDFVLFCDAKSADLVPSAPNFTKKVIKQPVFSMPGQLSWAREINVSAVDAFHSPHFPAPLLYRGPLAVTIHDLIPMAVPESMPSRAGFLYFQTMTRLGSRLAKTVITVSEFSKKDIVTRLGLPPEQVKVIYEAVDDRYQPVPEAKARKKVAERLGVTDPYLLYVGPQKPHKNLTNLIRAYAGLGPAVVERFSLVIIGEEDKRFPEAQQAARAYKVKRHVHFTGYVDEESMSAAYSAAVALVYPSLYEGFGFPPLEAMACGTPVVAASAASLPEVLGEAALFVDPHSVAEMTAALTRVMTEKPLRAQLITAGRKQVGKYSWKRAAEETLAVYRGLVGG